MGELTTRLSLQLKDCSLGFADPSFRVSYCVVWMRFLPSGCENADLL